MLILQTLVFTAVPLLGGFLVGRRLLSVSGVRLTAWPAIGGLLLGICIGYFTTTGVTLFHPLTHLGGNLLAGALVACYVAWRSDSPPAVQPRT